MFNQIQSLCCLGLPVFLLLTFTKAEVVSYRTESKLNYAETYDKTFIYSSVKIFQMASEGNTTTHRQIRKKTSSNALSIKLMFEVRCTHYTQRQNLTGTPPKSDAVIQQNKTTGRSTFKSGYTTSTSKGPIRA